VPWFLVDDRFPTHPSVLATSLAARGLWVTAGAWSSANLTDLVPVHVLASFGSTPELEAELARAGVWKRTRGAYRFTQEGLCRIPSRERAERDTKLATGRQARWRAGKRDRAPDGGEPQSYPPSTSPSTRPSTVDAGDNSDAIARAQDSRSQGRGRRTVDASTGASTPPSTWSPDPGPNPVVKVINRTNGSSPRASPAVIDSIMKEVQTVTGRCITPDWAQRVADHILKGDVANPAAYVRQAIRNEPNPRQRFLPLY
jgi:hypothetical protein